MRLSDVEPKPEQVTYRVVSEDELQLLAPYFKRLNWPQPDPNMAKAIVAEIGEGKEALIAGFQVVQYVVHAGPLWVDSKLRGTGVAEGLTETTEHYIEKDCGIKQYVCTAKAGSFGERLALEHGMKLVPERLFTKQVE